MRMLSAVTIFKIIHSKSIMTFHINNKNHKNFSILQRHPSSTLKNFKWFVLILEFDFLTSLGMLSNGLHLNYRMLLFLFSLMFQIPSILDCIWKTFMKSLWKSDRQSKSISDAGSHLDCSSFSFKIFQIHSDSGLQMDWPWNVFGLQNNL